MRAAKAVNVWIEDTTKTKIKRRRPKMADESESRSGERGEREEERG